MVMKTAFKRSRNNGTHVQMKKSVTFKRKGNRMKMQKNYENSNENSTNRKCGT